MSFRLTLCCPCWRKPQRTLRAINSVLDQDTNGWEALFIGDSCPDFQSFIDDGTFSRLSEKALDRGNEIHFINLAEHKGFWGYDARNFSIGLARGKYIVFLDNDDVLRAGHFRSYLSEIEGTDADMVHFNSYIEPLDAIRDSELSYGMIGHSEIIVRKESLQGFFQKPEYGHDWSMVSHLIRSGCKIRKSKNEPTYVVKAIGGDNPNRERLSESGID